MKITTAEIWADRNGTPVPYNDVRGRYVLYAKGAVVPDSQVAALSEWVTDAPAPTAPVSDPAMGLAAMQAQVASLSVMVASKTDATQTQAVAGDVSFLQGTLTDVQTRLTALQSAMGNGDGMDEEEFQQRLEEMQTVLQQAISGASQDVLNELRGELTATAQSALLGAQQTAAAEHAVLQVGIQEAKDAAQDADGHAANAQSAAATAYQHADAAGLLAASASTAAQNAQRQADTAQAAVDSLAQSTTQALAGKAASNDSRFTDSRTPKLHKSTHATGGNDALVPSDIGAASASDLTTAQNNITTLQGKQPLSGSASVVMPLIALGGSYSFDIPVTGATVGMTAVVNCPSGFLDLVAMFEPNIEEAGKVKVRLKSGLAIAAGTRTFIARVIP